MAKYNYKVKDGKGLTLKGLVEAQTVKQATNLLHERGYFIIALKEVTRSSIPTTFGGGVNFNDLVHFTRQIATMITAGLTLVEALGIFAQQIKKVELLKLINHIQDDIAGGNSFGSAIAKYPKLFPPIYLALVKAGEASGKLDVILSRLADNLEKSRDFKSKIKGALAYPIIVILGMVAVSIIVMTVVVPRMTSLYKEFGVSLPLPTQILIAMSNFMVNSWWLLILIMVGTIVFYLKWSKTYSGQHILSFISLNIPIFGPLVREATLVELTRTLSILIDGGVPILTALDIAREATANVLFKDAFAYAQKKVEKGSQLSEPLSENKLFPPILSQMVSVGEQTGKLGESLFKLSAYFETEADNAVRSLTTMIEPLIMIILGVGVGFLVIAVLMPIYSLTSKF